MIRSGDGVPVGADRHEEPERSVAPVPGGGERSGGSNVIRPAAVGGGGFGEYVYPARLARLTRLVRLQMIVDNPIVAAAERSYDHRAVGHGHTGAETSVLAGVGSVSLNPAPDATSAQPLSGLTNRVA